MVCKYIHSFKLFFYSVLISQYIKRKCLKTKYSFFDNLLKKNNTFILSKFSINKNKTACVKSQYVIQIQYRDFKK